MASQRIYTVTTASGTPVRLVRAISRAQAINHVARETFSADLASQETLVSALTNGVVVEDAKPSAEQGVLSEVVE